MTPNLSLPPAAANEDDNNNNSNAAAAQQHHLIQRLENMTTATSSRSGPTPVPVTMQQKEQPQSTLTTTTTTTTTLADINPFARQPSNSPQDNISSRRPTTPRSQTEPTFDFSINRLQPRNRSPYSRSHLRSQSSSASLSAPPMTRAHSLPTVMQPTGQLSLSPSPMPYARPSSPLRSPKGTRSPRALDPRPFTTTSQERVGSGIRPASLGSFEGSPSVCDISEDAELELTPRAGTGVSAWHSGTGSTPNSRRRRPVSPLHHASNPFGVSPSSTPNASTPTSGASSPLFAPAKFNEHYPSSLASSSVPSTPTSMRSRSPSISSLETIEDSPDAEEEATEEDRIAKLKAAADHEDGGEQRRSSLDVPDRGRTFGFGKRDPRKRWSVCGAERRGDLDLETIWED
ncbi:hypothetical protein GQ44DRAFT_711457 [Phaeosphaeriaceae sp. PMI808]|nr:hypothetical protein GQ44DRAFT_711457 [Phaeosphaeriaceae sp. PMI808]